MSKPKQTALFQYVASNLWFLLLCCLCFATSSTAGSSIDASPSSASSSSDNTSFTQSQLSKNYVSHQITPNGLVVTHTQGSITLNALHELAIEIQAQGQFNRSFPSFAKDPSAKLSAAIKFVEQENELVYSTKRLTVTIDKTTLALSFYKDGTLLTEEESGYFEQATLQGFRFKLDDTEKLLGTGQRVLGMNRRGHRVPLYNRAHYGYGTYSEQMNYSVPAVMSSKKYLILYDNPAKGAIDLGKTDKNILQFEATGGRQSYVFFAGDSYPDLIHQYVKVTGKQPMPARWTLGNHASRFGYRSQEEVLSTINLFKQADIPVDSIILDLYWFGKDVKGHMGNLDWDKSTFPDPQAMIESLDAQGVKTTLITEPFILTSSKRWQEAIDNDILAKNMAGTQVKEFEFYFGETGLIDVFAKPAQNWFSDIYTDIADQGVAGVWGDLGEPEVHPKDMVHWLTDWDMSASSDEVHNAYGHQWAKIAFEAQQQANPDARPFIIMRAGFAGSQRYGFIPWTGDVSRSWDGLKPQPELTMQMSLLGLAYTHSDLGGFAGGDKFDKEMYIRWLQYGVFQPIYRPHAQDNIAPEPVFHDQQTQDIVREFIKLRYRLMPYNYTLAYLNHLTGMPLMRPMFFSNESNIELIDMADQYMWGDSFLVKPITTPSSNSNSESANTEGTTKAGVITTSVYLPKGQWTYYWTGQKYIVSDFNGTHVKVNTDLATIPVFVKGGAIIPTVRDHDNATEYSSEHLRLDVYFDPARLVNEHIMYEDDGKSANAIKNNQYETLTFSSVAADQNGQAVMNLTLERNVAGNYHNMPKSRKLLSVIHHWPNRPKDISVDGQPIALMLNQTDFDLEPNAAFYNYKTKQLIIKTNWHQQASKIIIK